MRKNGSPSYKCILFDLDDTLYPREAGLMTAIYERMILFMVQKVGIPADDAPLKRLYFFQQYGTTLRGLIEEHRIDPLEFLEFVHDVDPRNFFGASPPLNRMLQNIPLRKVIFTNSDIAHCRRVLGVLQVEAHFETIIDIEAINYRSKPDPLAYQRVLEILKVPAESCILVEDSPRNLIPAKDLGMTTILVAGSGPSLAVDYAVPTVFHVEKVLQELLSDSPYR
jgi:putative hydrolase of the HAD superfamily